MRCGSTKSPAIDFATERSWCAGGQIRRRINADRLSADRLSAPPEKECSRWLQLNRLDAQFIRIGWLLVGVDNGFDQRGPGRSKGGLDCRPNFLRPLAPISVGAAGAGKGEKVDW